MIFTFVRASFARFFHGIIKSRGYDIISRSKFGYDPFLDVQKLSVAWKIPINCFFDVGANEGQTSAAAKRYFPDASIFAFEPHPKTFVVWSTGWLIALDLVRRT